MRTKTLAALACLGLLCARSGNALAAAAPKAPAKQGKAVAAETLPADPAEIVRQLLAVFSADKAGVEIERTGLALGISAGKAAAVLGRELPGEARLGPATSSPGKSPSSLHCPTRSNRSSRSLPRAASSAFSSIATRLTPGLRLPTWPSPARRPVNDSSPPRQVVNERNRKCVS